jgi:hypothetical protein
VVELTPKWGLRCGQNPNWRQVVGQDLLLGIHSVTTGVLGGIYRDFHHTIPRLANTKMPVLLTDPDGRLTR